MNLTFAQPQFFWLLALLPLLAGLKILSDLRGRALLRKAAAPRLWPQLLTTTTRWRGWIALSLEMAAFICFTATLARPQLGFVEEEVFSSGRSLLVAVDTSKSMLATDVAPNRLFRAKLVISDLIRQLRGDRIGLLAFAGKPFLQAPITQDHDALLETLDQIDAEIIPRGGSNLAEVIDLALETFRAKPGEEAGSTAQLQSTSQALLIFSDGEETEGQVLAAAKKAADQNVTIISVGVGTRTGGIIPDPDRGGRDYVKDTSGKIVKTVLMDDVLEQIARLTRGLYIPLAEVATDRRLDLVLSKLNASSNKSKTMKKPIERYRWPLTGGLLFVLGALAVRLVPGHAPRNGRPAPVGAGAWLLLCGAFMLMTAGPGNAAPAPAGEPAQKTLGELMQELIKPARPEAAVQIEADLKKLKSSREFRLHPDAPEWTRLGEGSAAHARGDYDAAVAAFGYALLGEDAALQAQAHFNLANSLYQRAALAASAKNEQPEESDQEDMLAAVIGSLENCVEQYDETLSLEPKHESAGKSKAIVEKLLAALKEQQKQQQEQKGKGKKGKKGKKSGEKGEGEEGEEGDGEGDGQGNPKDGKKGRGKKGEKSKNGEGKGEEEGEDGEGENGDKPNEKGSGKDGDKKKDGRSEEQKQKEKEALEASNKEVKGKVEAGGEGQNPGDKSQKNGKPSVATSEDKVNNKTGFSRSEARRGLTRFSDDVQVRPRIETAPPDRPFKNW